MAESNASPVFTYGYWKRFQDRVIARLCFSLHPAMPPDSYEPTHPFRFVTATSLFHGPDAVINIMRRILQATAARG